LVQVSGDRVLAGLLLNLALFDADDTSSHGELLVCLRLGGNRLLVSNLLVVAASRVAPRPIRPASAWWAK
jgi:hypothetical protein